MAHPTRGTGSALHDLRASTAGRPRAGGRWPREVGRVDAVRHAGHPHRLDHEPRRPAPRRSAAAASGPGTSAPSAPARSQRPTSAAERRPGRPARRLVQVTGHDVRRRPERLHRAPAPAGRAAALLRHAGSRCTLATVSDRAARHRDHRRGEAARPGQPPATGSRAACADALVDPQGGQHRRPAARLPPAGPEQAAVVGQRADPMAGEQMARHLLQAGDVRLRPRAPPGPARRRRP